MGGVGEGEKAPARKKTGARLEKLKLSALTREAQHNNRACPCLPLAECWGT